MGLAKKVKDFSNPIVTLKQPLRDLPREEVQRLLAGTTSLREYCRVFGYRFRQRKQGRRYYVTVSHDNVSVTKWKQDYDFVVGLFYPNAYMTSGSSSGATYMIGDVFEMLKR